MTRILYYYFVVLIILLVTALCLDPVHAAEPIKVAVIDTGYNAINTYEVSTPICKEGHFSFRTFTNKIGVDFYGHGTAMSSIIAKQAGPKGYCLLIYNVAGMFGLSSHNIVKAIYLAVKNGAKVINLSLAGRFYNEEEHQALLYAAKNKVKLFVAAGNDNENMNIQCTAYPACYKNVRSLTVVGALDAWAQKASYSNYGRMLTWYPGTVLGVSGTSSATAYATGQYTRYILNKREKNK